VAGGSHYSPDFAYVVKDAQGKQSLNLIVETKDKQKRDLSTDEKQRIRHAEHLFNNIGSDVKVKFETQFNGHKIAEIIKSHINNSVN
jgi:type III restriction enzyme